MPSRRHSRPFASRYRAIAAPYTRRRFGGRHPSCGIGVTSRMAVISRPAACRERMAASRPAPGPRTKTSICFRPYSIALRAANSEAVWAAKGVLLREPLNPALPALDQDTTFPMRSVSVTIVLLNVAWMWAMPVRTSRRSRFLPPFFRGVGFASSAMPYAPAFFGAAAGAAAGAGAAVVAATWPRLKRALPPPAPPSPRASPPPATRAIVPSARSALSRLVPRVLADDPRHAATLDDLAVLAAHLDRRSYFHRSCPRPGPYLNR